MKKERIIIGAGNNIIGNLINKGLPLFLPNSNNFLHKTIRSLFNQWIKDNVCTHFPGK